MLKIECPFCGKIETREFREEHREVHHSIVCGECKLIEKGRMTIAHMLTAISVIVSTRPTMNDDPMAVVHLLRLQVSLKEALGELDLYIDEVPF